MLQQCRHFQTNGSRCRQVAVTGRPLCHYHQNRQPAAAAPSSRPRVRPSTTEPSLSPSHAPLELVFPEDRASIQINLFRVFEALTQNRIDTRTANSMTWYIQASMNNLGRKP